MLTFDTLRQWALALPETTEEPHFEKSAFKVKKKIFATYNPAHHRTCVKLSLVDQSVFCSADTINIFPVDNNFGNQGWTLINMSDIDPQLLLDALTTAYCTVAPKKLALQVRPPQPEEEDISF